VLCKALSTHPDIDAFGELFHDAEAARWPIRKRRCKVDEDPVAFCESVLWNPEESAKQCVGFKVFAHQARTNDCQYRLWPWLASDRALRVIFLQRDNLFDTYVSGLRSLRSNVWHLDISRGGPTRTFLSQLEDDSGVRYLSDGEAFRSAHDEPLVVDPHEFRKFADRTTAEVDWLKSTFSGHPSLSLTYEEMAADFPAALSKACRFLGQSEIPCAVPFLRLNGAPHEIGVVNMGKSRSISAVPFTMNIFSTIAAAVSPTASRLNPPEQSRNRPGTRNCLPTPRTTFAFASIA
jgi:hypothetical protein